MKDQMSKMVSECQKNITETLQTHNKTSFKRDEWKRPGGGGGITCAFKEGALLEKGGVNVSTVYGSYSKQMQQMMPLNLDCKIKNPDFFATGISLVLHPKNPMSPTVHMNYRYFEVYQGSEVLSWWFGGGADLSPSYLFPEDVIHFHETYKECCDEVDKKIYPSQKKACDDYFYIPHRKEHRGVGGIFLFRENLYSQEAYFSWAKSCANAFLESYLPILEKRNAHSFTDQERQWQQLRRGRYVEFNLMYDKGTTFGLQSGGNIESILMSLPSCASWDYNVSPLPGSKEAEMQEVLKTPREWI
ncbi:oxygen-dependent coproporphyrinogen oxidase [Chlamydiales bacterium]|nr:oxygen-dependent coproporphyrinogen oxidase [Chlamydiales bacterium]